MREDYGQKQDVPLCPVKRISVVYNLKKTPAPSEPDDKYEEYDPISTVQSVADTLSSFGFDVSLCEQDENFFDSLREQSPSFVVTLAEGRGNARGREAQVPSILESLDIPFWGSDSVSLALALDKLLTSRTLAGENIPVPLAASFRTEGDLGKIPSLFGKNDRFVVKPRFEGSSKGIFTDSVAHNASEMEEKVRRLWHRYGQPALVEEYLPGEEITVGVLGNEKPQVAGMMRISPRTPGDEFLYSLEEKRNYLERIRYEGPEAILPVTRQSLEASALAAFSALELRDMARIDFRLDGNGVGRIIDVNPLPGLSPIYSDLPILHRLSGGEYEELLRFILTSAFSRYGLAFPVPVEEGLSS